jgi:hypothetical protein
VNDERRRDRTMMLKKFYEFFSLLYDQKVSTPFSQFLEGDFLREFKINIRNLLDGKEDAFEKKKIKKKEHTKPFDFKLKVNNNISYNNSNSSQAPDSENVIKETSRFGSTPVENLAPEKK